MLLFIPTTGYTKEDLDWMDKSSRSSVEMSNESCRPEIAYKRDNMSEYDMIFVGFPIWLAYHKLIQCTLGCQRVHFYDYPYSKNDRVHFQTQGCKFNDSYSENDSIVKLYPQGSRKRYNPYSKNDNSTYEGASSITKNALTMGVFVYSKNDSSDF